MHKVGDMWHVAMLREQRNVTYIYGLREKGTKEFRYIGKTQTPVCRLGQHIGNVSQNDEKEVWLTDLVERQAAIEMVILHVVPAELGHYTEREECRTQLSKGARLVNGEAVGISNKAPPRVVKRHRDPPRRRT